MMYEIISLYSAMDEGTAGKDWDGITNEERD